MNKRKLGSSFEEVAAEYLRRHRLIILEKNYRTVQGEVDIIARDGDTIVFVEIKYRKTADFGYPAEAVSQTKQRKICLVARQYCYLKRITGQIRYDVISICGEEIEWYKNAFDHWGYY